MKYLIPAAAILGLAFCGLLRRENSVLGQPGAGIRNAAQTPERLGGPEFVQNSAERVFSIPSEAKSTQPKTESVALQTGPGVQSQEMEFVLRDELELSEQQLTRISLCFQDRAVELQECHEVIRKSGVFVPKEYGKALGRMKDGWYRRIDAVLDTRQHARFEELVAEGFLRSGTEFTINLNEMVVVQ